VAGLVTAKVRPERAGTNVPSMKQEVRMGAG
jgi:hypothetical protein